MHGNLGKSKVKMLLGQKMVLNDCIIKPLSRNGKGGKKAVTKKNVKLTLTPNDFKLLIRMI